MPLQKLYNEFKATRGKAVVRDLDLSRIGGFDNTSNVERLLVTFTVSPGMENKAAQNVLSYSWIKVVPVKVTKQDVEEVGKWLGKEEGLYRQLIGRVGEMARELNVNLPKEVAEVVAELSATVAYKVVLTEAHKDSDKDHDG